MKLEILSPEEVINFVKWTTANLRDERKLPTTFSVERSVEAWAGKIVNLDVELNAREVRDLHVELGFVAPDGNVSIEL